MHQPLTQPPPTSPGCPFEKQRLRCPATSTCGSTHWKHGIRVLETRHARVKRSGSPLPSHSLFRLYTVVMPTTARGPPLCCCCFGMRCAAEARVVHRPCSGSRYSAPSTGARMCWSSAAPRRPSNDADRRASRPIRKRWSSVALVAAFLRAAPAQACADQARLPGDQAAK
jgi:hypothetical protein